MVHYLNASFSKSRKYVSLFGLILLSIFFSACGKDSGEEELSGNWVRSSDFDGNARSEAVLFTIDDKVYMSTGTTDRERFKDLWQYDANNKFWIRKSDMPGSARSSAVAFSIGGKGYIATGFDGANKLKDVWEYDPSTDQWNKKNDFPGSARYDAVAFTIGNKAYISCGFDGNYQKDLWEYNPTADSWTQKASLGGSKRSAATSFVVNNKAYVVSGDNNGSVLNDIWEYDPSVNTWKEKRKITNATDNSYDDKYTNIARSNAVALVVNELVYISTGEAGSLLQTTWEYNPATDLWTEHTGFEGTPRTGALGFTLNKNAFLLTGRSGALSFDNMYEFLPKVKYNKND